MTFSQEVAPVVPSTRHVLAVPVAVAVARMPSELRAGLAVVTVQRVAGRSEWTWNTAQARGTARLSAASATATLLEITTDSGSTAAVADAFTVELYGVLERAWAPPPAGPARNGLGARSKVAIGVAAVLIPLLALTGMRMLAPPKAMDVASAVTQF